MLWYRACSVFWKEKGKTAWLFFRSVFSCKAEREPHQVSGFPTFPKSLGLEREGKEIVRFQWGPHHFHAFWKVIKQTTLWKWGEKKSHKWDPRYFHFPAILHEKKHPLMRKGFENARWKVKDFKILMWVGEEFFTYVLKDYGERIFEIQCIWSKWHYTVFCSHTTL